MTDFISRFSNEFIGRKSAFDGETPRLQSQRTRNDTKRAVAVCQLGRIFVVRPTVAAATSKSTGKEASELIDTSMSNDDFSSSHLLSHRTSIATFC
jgi:hypothetical protein